MRNKEIKSKRINLDGVSDKDTEELPKSTGTYEISMDEALGDFLKPDSQEGEKTLGLDNDLVFAVVLSREDIAIPLLSDILGRKVKSIISTKAQETIIGITPDTDVTTVRLDVVSELELKGNEEARSDVEIQAYREINYFKRIRMYGSSMDCGTEHRKGKKGNPSSKYDLHDRYMISFVSDSVNDHVRDTLAYQVCRLKNQRNEIIDDGVTWVIVNYDKIDQLISEGAPSTVIDVARQIKRLEPITSFEKQLVGAVDDFIANEEWRKSAMTFGEKLENAHEDGFKKGRKEGQEQERALIFNSLSEYLKSIGATGDQISATIKNVEKRLGTK